MAEWRIGWGWADAELKERLQRARALERNFSEALDVMAHPPGWNHYFSQAVIGREVPGPPVAGGPYDRGRKAVANYEFSDPRIVIAHFARDQPLQDRRILLEIRALRLLHYLSAVVVTEVRADESDRETVFGFRYDTLEGHIEKGAEWFLLTKNHETGAIRFRIEAAWRPGQFPNWWSRAGFSILGPFYQEIWHRRAHAIMVHLVRDPTLSPPAPGEEGLVHSPSEVIFKRRKASNV